MTPRLDRLVAQERKRQRAGIAAAAACAAVAGVSAVLLLGLSGWFITASAMAGAAGAASALAFNYMLPSAGVRLLAITRTASRYGERIKGHEAALGALARIRPALFASLAAAPAVTGLRLSGGEASARLIQDVDAIESRFVRLSSPWGAGAAMLTGLALTALAGWPPVLALALLLPISLWVQHGLIARLSRRPAADVQRVMGELKDGLGAFVQSSAELRCYDLEDWAAESVERKSRDLGAAQLRVVSAQGAIALVRAAFVGVAVAVVLALSAGAPLPLAALAVLAAVVAMEGAEGLGRTMEQNGAALAASLRLEAVLGHVPRPQSFLKLASPRLRIGQHLFRPGERIAIQGDSGSGKTSLFEKLLRLREIEPGRVLLGGADLAALAPEVARSTFAYAPQEVVLLAGTVRDNLALADPAATEEAMWRALHDAGLDARVRGEADGLDAWIGENGSRLSGGERRRLGLARALLRPAAWLVLDEPTEGLDAWTEALVVKRVRERLDRSGQGLILATHRHAPTTLVHRDVHVAELWEAPRATASGDGGRVVVHAP